MFSPDLELVGSYNYRLVALSVFIAVLASYTALDLAGRVTSARGKARKLWLSGGAIAMGIGIWSMHYVGMLAFHLPIPVQYDWPTVAVSLLAAIFASAIALFVVSRERMGLQQAVAGSFFMGAGIAGHALHRHGRDAASGHVPLFSRDRRNFHRCGNFDFFRCPAAGISFSRGNEIGRLAKSPERGSHGSGDPGHALHGNGSGRLHVYQIRQQ